MEYLQNFSPGYQFSCRSDHNEVCIQHPIDGVEVSKMNSDGKTKGNQYITYRDGCIEQEDRNLIFERNNVCPFESIKIQKE